MASKELLYVEDALGHESLDIQNKIYNLMAEKGWYKTTTVEQTKIDNAKQKYMEQ